MFTLQRIVLAGLVLSPTILLAQSQQEPGELLRAEITKLTATHCQESTPAAVRAVNQRLLERRRETYASLLEQSIAQVREYELHSGIGLAQADKKDVDDAISSLEAELARARQPITKLCPGPGTSSVTNATLASTEQPLLREVALWSPAVHSALSSPPFESDSQPMSPGASRRSEPVPQQPQPGQAPNPQAAPADQTPPDYLLGPVRAYFSGGTVIAAGGNQFQSSAVFVGLNVDNTWYRRAETDNKKWWALRARQVNTYFDARLTTVPVSSCVQSTTSTSGCTTSSAGTIDTFNSSKKSALISGGFYLPYYGKTWEGNDAKDGHVLFFAPLVKGGLQTLVDPSQTTSTPAGGTPTTITTLRNQTFFHYFGTGARFGLYYLHNETGKKIPPDPIIYLDIVGGKWENFAKTDPMTGRILDHPWRIGLEGRFRIPGLPFVMGFDSNTRTGNSPGDLRFLFGTTFDVGCMYQKLTGTGQPAKGCESNQSNAQKQAGQPQPSD